MTVCRTTGTARYDAYSDLPAVSESVDDNNQTCQVTLISRVRPAFWPTNPHSPTQNLY